MCGMRQWQCGLYVQNYIQTQCWLLHARGRSVIINILQGDQKLEIAATHLYIRHASTPITQMVKLFCGGLRALWDYDKRNAKFMTLYSMGIYLVENEMSTPITILYTVCEFKLESVKRKTNMYVIISLMRCRAT